MKNKQATILLIVISIIFALSCKMFGGSETNSNQTNNSNANNPVAAPAETPRSFDAKNFLTYAKANESELAKMLADKPIIISGEVWSGGSRFGGPFSFEFWTNEGRISCHGNLNIPQGSSDPKASLLDKATGDYLSKRANRMPFVKAKGVYKSVYPPAAKPNDYWKIIMENCELLEVIP